MAKGYVGVPTNAGSKARELKLGDIGIEDRLIYTELEYIESTGTQYIDTGVLPKSSTRMVLDMALTDLTASNRCGWGSSGSQESFGAGLTNSTFTTFFGACSANSYYTTLASVDTNRHSYDISNSAIKQDDVTYGTGNIGNTATAGQTLYLLSYHVEWDSSGVVYGKQRVFFCKIYDGSALVRDFIPVLDLNGTPCLYDKVLKKFFYNGGTGDFVASEQRTPIYNKLGRLKKGYVGVNGKARVCYYMPYPIFTVLTNISVNHSAYSMISHTKDHIIIGGGQATTDNPLTTVSCVNKDGVISAAPDLPAKAMNGATMNISGYAMFMSGVTGSGSWAGRTPQVVTYNNDLVRSSATNVTQESFNPSSSSNGSKGVFACGSAWGFQSLKVDFYDSNLVKTTASDSSGSRYGDASNVGNYFILCGSEGSASTATDFYNANNVKSTSTNPYGKKCFFPRGLHTKNRALFFGGATTDSTNNMFTTSVSYDTNLVRTNFNIPIAAYKCRGFECPDGRHVWVGFGAKENSWLYNDDLVVEKVIAIQMYIGYGNSNEADSNTNFAVVKQSWSTYITILSI